MRFRCARGTAAEALPRNIPPAIPGSPRLDGQRDLADVTNRRACGDVPPIGAGDWFLRSSPRPQLLDTARDELARTASAFYALPVVRSLDDAAAVQAATPAPLTESLRPCLSNTLTWPERFQGSSALSYDRRTDFRGGLFGGLGAYLCGRRASGDSLGDRSPFGGGIVIAAHADGGIACVYPGSRSRGFATSLPAPPGPIRTRR